MLSSFQSIEDPQWIYPHENEALKERIIKEFKIHPVIAQVLVSRGFRSLESIHDYLYSRLPNLLDPFLFPDMQKAADRVVEAVNRGENILIYGDNDVDGMTGVALLVEFLRFIGANVFFFLSNRSMRRQAIIIEALDFALKNQCKLLITVDCGITAAQEVEEVAKKGVDVIITDHHEPTGAIPHCIATLNPKLNEQSYPNRDLTGVGVAFKLAHAVTNLLVSEGTIPPKKIDLKRYLDLVALGTISDMGALLGENRILVTYGLNQLKKTKRNGLIQLIKVTGLTPSQVNTHAVASKIAPRLNSLGRIDDPTKGVELLLVRSTQKAEKMALELDLNNLERQKIEKIMVDDVENTFHIHPEILKNKAIVLDSDWWHPGIIAILSTRISKFYNRPTVVMATDEEFAKGSLRSIPAFPLLDVLKGMSDILLNFGGHDLAAGLTMKIEHLDTFRKRFLDAAEKALTLEDVKPKLNLDAEVHFNEISFDFMESLKLLEPSGNGNPPPTLYTKAKQAWPPKVIGKHHLKLYLQQGDRMLEGMAFGKASMLSQLKKKNLGEIEVAFQPQINNYQGPSIQLLIRDIKLDKKSPAG